MEEAAGLGHWVPFCPIHEWPVLCVGHGIGARGKAASIGEAWPVLLLVGTLADVTREEEARTP